MSSIPTETLRPITRTHCGREPDHRGKVRDLYDLGDRLLLVATDRLSAFDFILPTPIPGRGAILTRLSCFWFRRFEGWMDHHLLEFVETRAPAGFEPYLNQLAGRTMVCRKTKPIPIECVVRGYLAGSAWKTYQESGSICGVPLPPGLHKCQELPEPIFTPATKAVTGHDENITFEEAASRVGGDLMMQLRQKSLRLYREASAHARGRGVVIADTKFEFGVLGDQILLIDEVLTPDSSRFWAVGEPQASGEPESLDKQFVRDFLLNEVEAGRWDFKGPPPALPEPVVQSTFKRYRGVAMRLMGEREKAEEGSGPSSGVSPDDPRAVQGSPPEEREHVCRKVNDSKRIRRRLCYSGRVQGVGFRYAALRLASGFDVTGFVRNRPDGRVELVAEGPAPQVEGLAQAVRRAMTPNIEAVEAAESVATGEFEGFTIRH